MNRVSILAGKVIDRNQGVAQQSFAWALQIDQELEDLYKQLDPSWLEYSELLLDMETNAAEIHERIIAQVIYNQIRVHLHLPFMLKSQSNSRFSYSRTACLSGSREILRLYQAMRTGAVGPLYECKAVDFIGFTSAILVMLGIFNYGAQNAVVSLKEKEEDIRLIEISIDIFRRASSEKGGKVAMQSGKVLEKMLSKYRMEQAGQVDFDPECDGPDKMEFVIPYFGTISIRRGGRTASYDDAPDRRAARKLATACASSTPPNPKFTTPSDTSSTPFTFSQYTTSNPGLTTPSTEPTSNPSPSQAHPPNFGDPFVSYDGFYNWGGMLDTQSSTAEAGTATGTQINDDSLSNYPLPTNNFSWQNMPMDIDQDWSWFLNDGGVNAGGNAGTTNHNNNQPSVGDLFSQQAFSGFG